MARTGRSITRRGAANMSPDRAVNVSISFAQSLYAYVRQAALSLHRTPATYRKTMLHYYQSHDVPGPGRVLSGLEAQLKTTKPRTFQLLCRLVGTSIALDTACCESVKNALRGFEFALKKNHAETDSEKIKVRLALSNAEALLRQKLGRRSRRVANVKHLNETPDPLLKPLSELVQPGWPDRLPSA
jgi:hypothetical protein